MVSPYPRPNPPELSPLPGSWIAPRQENQFGGFLSLFEERLAWRAYLRAHGQPTRQIRDLGCARGYRKVS